jgi:hypothetical protein
MGEGGLDPALREALESALDDCRQALADYQAGLLDDVDLQRVLFRAGLVHGADEAWLLDLSAGQWWRYDGLALGAAPSPLTSAGVARLRQVIDGLARDLGVPGRGEIQGGTRR